MNFGRIKPEMNPLLCNQNLVVVLWGLDAICKLSRAFTRSGKDVTEAARTICNLPVELPEDGIAVSEEPLEIRGELYAPNLSRTKSQALAAGHLRKKNPNGAGLSFVAYEILGSTQNEIDDIKKLESWFFEIPPTNRTADPKQVKRWHKEWLTGELFEKPSL